MNDEIDEMFAFLTFFKICRTYQVLRRSRHRTRTKSRSPEERQHNLATATKVIQRAEPKRNFSMFSQTHNKLVQKQLLDSPASTNVKLVPSSSHTKDASRESPAVPKSTTTLELNLMQSQEHVEDTSQVVDQKGEMCFSDWQVTKQLQACQRPEPKEEIIENLDENQDIIGTIFEQISENDMKHDDVEIETEVPTTQENIDFQISFAFNAEDTSRTEELPALPEEEPETSVVVVKKKRRRRRRPGDPPLSPLPKLKKKLHRRYRIRPEHMNRFQESYFQTVFRKIKKSNDETRFIQLVRITRESFETILKYLRFPMQQHKQSVQAEERLAITLMYLAHGMHFDLIRDKFKLGKSTIRFIVLQTCELLWDILSPTYMRDPTSEDYVRIASDFKKRWNLPNCAGALGMKRVPFKTSRIVPGYKWNEVQDLVLMGACDANHIFRSISITVEPHQSQFYKSIINNTLPLPPGCPLDDESPSSDFPYYLAGNETFPLRPNLMRPFSGDNLTGRNSIYNSSLASGQGVCDTAFDILSSMWRVLVTNCSFSIENWDSIIKACIVMYNFVMINEKQRWFQADGRVKSTWPENVPLEEISEWINESYPVVYASHLESVSTTVGESNESGIETREMLADYFCIEETKNW